MSPRDPLHEQARDLPREVPPPRDLWPDIAARLDEAPREEPATGSPTARAAADATADADAASPASRPDVAAWRARLGLRPVLAAAALAAATLLVVLLASPERVGGPAPGLRADGPPAGGPWADAAPLGALDRGYQQVRDDLVTVLDSRCDQWPASACQGLRTGLRELDQTARELREALRQAPPGSESARQLTGQYQRTLEQARGLAGRAARL